MTKKVFEKTNIGGIEVNNRFIKSATGEGIATIDGYVTEDILDMYREASLGKVGLIITGTICIMENNTFPPKLLRINDDSYIEGLKKLTDVVHEKNSKIIAQLAHKESLEIMKYDTKKLIEAFGEAALKSKNAGFDGVQVHVAHGNILTKFLSPYYNKREDEYGETIENRARIVVEILNNIKTKCGKEFPVFLKINSSDFLDNDKGFTYEHSKESIKIFSKSGYDAIEISGGIVGEGIGPVRTKIHLKEQEAYHRKFAEKIAEEVTTPIILVGGIRSLEVAEEILTETNIKAISLSRPLIREPKLIKRWLEEDTKKSKCVSCNKCFGPEGAVCIVNR